MSKQENEYQRLPGRTVFRPNRLYLGRDHLLRVNSNGWTENYRRFYFSDIQALIICRDNRGLIWNVALACFTALALFSIFIEKGAAGRFTLEILAGFCGGLLFINMMRGPTCCVRIYTPIGGESLPSVNRMSSATRLLDLIKPKVQAAQGELSAGEMPAKLQETARAAIVSPVRRAENSTKNDYAGTMHVWMFYVLFAVAGIVGIEIFSRTVWITIISALSGFLLACLTVLALVKQQKSNIGDGLCKLSWAVLGYVIAGFVAGYALLIYTTVSHASQQPHHQNMNNDPLSIYRWIAEIPLLNNPWLLGMSLLFVVMAVLIGVPGLIMALNFRAAAKNSQMEAPLP